MKIVKALHFPACAYGIDFGNSHPSLHGHVMLSVFGPVFQVIGRVNGSVLRDRLRGWV